MSMRGKVKPADFSERMTPVNRLAAAKKRERKAAELIHPKEETQIRERARENVIEDLTMLIEQAVARRDGGHGPRTKLLASEESFLLGQALLVVKNWSGCG